MMLSILICTLNEPFYINGLKRLNNILDPQIERYPGRVEKLINDAGRSVSTGQKRNELIKNSEGEYFCFIDSDDMVPSYYVDELMKAIEREPDVITFNGWITEDGGNKKNFTIKLGESYIERSRHYYRYPNHLCIFKRSLVEHVKFPHITTGEDFAWATSIRDQKLLNTEVHIQHNMYEYLFISPHKRQ